MVSNITPDIVDSPPSKPSPTPRLTTCRTLRRSHDAVAMYSVSIANRKQASIFDTNVPATNGEPFTDGSSRSVARRNPTPTKPPTNTTRYIRPSARGLNRACMRFIGASGICGGCLDAAAPDGRTSARATSATSIDCVAGFGSSPAFGESAARCSCDSITFPLYLAFRGQRRSAPAIRQRAGRRCRLPNLVRVYTCVATKHRTCPIRWITVDNFGWP